MILNRKLIFLIIASACSGPLYATEFGTASEARTMLERGIAALENDKPAALVAFNDADGAYRDRDLYIFCAGSDGLITAHAKDMVHWSLREWIDISGEAIGEEMYSVATEGKISEVSYLYTRGDDPIPFEKTSLITKVGDQLCGVGYYNAGKRTRSGNLTINNTLGIVADGYDVVAYFTLGQATKGTSRYRHKWLGSEWHFVNSEHRELFIKNPIKYFPQYGGYCSSAMSQGFLVPVDPTSWTIVDGKLYLHFSKQSHAGWGKNRDANIANADANWEKIKPGLSN